MENVNVRHLNIKRISSSKTPNDLNRKTVISKYPFRINKNYFRESNKENKKNLSREIENTIIEEEKEDSNRFRKTYNNKPMFHRITPKSTFYNIYNRKNSVEDKKMNANKKLPRNMSTHSLSKDSTLYRTKNRLLSSVKLKNKSMALSPKRSTFYPKNGRSFSAININNNNKSIKINNEAKKSNTIGNGGFITALDPVVGQNQIIFDQSDTRSDNRSYFLRKLKAEKKFLSYFDIQRILFLDRKVYKPNKEFEKKIYQLKNNNSDEFIMNFDFDKYKLTILRLFQRQVSSQNFEIMKKNFELINKGWKWRDNSKKRRRRIVRSVTSETERELRYIQKKLERKERIREKYSK